MSVEKQQEFFHNVSKPKELAFGVGVVLTVLITKYYSGDQIKKNEVGGTCSTMGNGRGSYRVLVGRPEGRTNWKTQA